MKKMLTLLAGFALSYSVANAASVDTALIHSASMNKDVKCVVVKPNSYASNSTQKFPVVYLLHGYSGSYNNWVKKVPEVQTLADQYNLIIVCPDGAFSSWYFDSPVDPTMRYETNVAVEIPAYIEQNYRTIQDRKARAITGLSMGGHGGLYLGFRHADYFGACGSMSGAMVISMIKKGYDMQKLLGDTTNTELYNRYSVMYEMEHYPKDSLAIIMDCGVDDFVIEMSRAAHQKMLKLKIPHDYTERPGKHDWKYWQNSLKYQLLYFREFFTKNGY
ncbi:MAG: esterase family protein [Filimonas sp.]|nr:esterase family protein [Filimonas sp.]